MAIQIFLFKSPVRAPFTRKKKQKKTVSVLLVNEVIIFFNLVLNLVQLKRDSRCLENLSMYTCSRQLLEIYAVTLLSQVER